MAGRDLQYQKETRSGALEIGFLDGRALQYLKETRSGASEIGLVERSALHMLPPPIFTLGAAVPIVGAVDNSCDYLAQFIRPATEKATAPPPSSWFMK